MALIASYSESNADSYNGYGTTTTVYGQSFLAPDTYETVDSCIFSLRKFGSPTGSAYAKLYLLSSYSDTSPELLATSEALDVSTLTTTPANITFTFTTKSGIDKDGYYLIAVEYSAGSSGNVINIGNDQSSPSHAGQWIFFTSPNWGTDTSSDVSFYVYGTLPSTTITENGTSLIFSTNNINLSKGQNLSPSSLILSNKDINTIQNKLVSPTSLIYSVPISSELIDSYPLVNYDYDNNDLEFYYYSGLSFTANSSLPLKKVQFYLKNVNSATGNIVCYLYSHTGEFGTGTGIPQNILAVSDVVDISSVSSSYSLVDFNFSGINKYSLEAGKHYCAILYSTDLGYSYLSIGSDISEPTFTGTHIISVSNGIDWMVGVEPNFIFYAYGESGSLSFNIVQTLSSAVLVLSAKALTTIQTKIVNPTSLIFSFGILKVVKEWVKRTKNISTWTGKSKNISTFTNKSKNTSIWTHKPKN
jgi:hypothetical protein